MSQPNIESGNVSSIKKLRQDPEMFVEKILKHDPWDIPREIYRSLSKPNARVAVKACHSSGKCVAADEPVLLADGSRVPAFALVGKEFRVLTSSPNGHKITKANAEWNLIEQVVSVTTDSGRSITRSTNHPLYCMQKNRRGYVDLIGWQPVANISVGEYVAVPYNLSGLEFEDTNMPDSLIKVCAYLTAGLSVSGLGPRIPDADRKCFREFNSCLSEIGFDVTPYDGVTFGQYLYEAHPKGNILDRLISLGVESFDVYRKEIPGFVFRLPLEKQALFLSRLFSIGGYIDQTNRYRISFYTKSERMARDVQHLLLAQEITASIHDEGFAYKVYIDHIVDCVQFLTTCGIFGQEKKCITALKWYQEWVDTHPHQDSRSRNKKDKWPTLNEGLMWERVARVELAGVKPTVAISVPVTNTFITSFWEHNTHTSADSVYWFTCTGGKTITTAPTWPQVEKLLWGEMHRTYDWVGSTLGGELLNTQFRITSNAYAFGISTDKGVNMQGHHDSGGGVLIIIDEAPGVRPDIWEAIEGIRAGGDVRILALGNPVTVGGPFFEAFNKDQAQWDTYTISAFNTPNLRGISLEQLLQMSPAELNHNERPYLVTRRWVYEKWHQWGEDNPNWKSRVMGEFPDQASFDLLSNSWLDEATKPGINDPLTFDFQAGLDIAGAGSDNTALTVRHGGNIKHQEEWGNEDPRREVAEALRFWHGSGRLLVAVDSIGIGHYFVKYLQDEGFNVVPVNVSSKPIDDLIWVWGVDEGDLPSKRFGNLKAQLYWGLREKFQRGEIRGLSQEARRQLKTIRWREDERNGKIYIESKDSLKRRGVSSPDLAESVMLAFADVGLALPIIPLSQASTTGWGF